MVGSREGCEGFQTLCGGKKKSKTKKGTYSPVAVTVSTLMSHRRSLTKTGSRLTKSFPGLLRRLQRRSQKSIEHSRFLW